ncbi:hypothetical protein EXIGLDRAFT_773203 [Exidia glandulosa HHB12029]|uniref:Uncharacterized protein n=1 Tax=Exidia glandulosa HHB12029 TaxID=1314781 RepID=A0A165EXF0_EXIGL|nr:hypothetical protein EXIGLDRAFT_773203 [Exidia glandulosa HHB12029]
MRFAILAFVLAAAAMVAHAQCTPDNCHCPPGTTGHCGGAICLGNVCNTVECVRANELCPRDVKRENDSE